MKSQLQKVNFFSNLLYSTYIYIRRLIKNYFEDNIMYSLK